MSERCELCRGRVCLDAPYGRLINDNEQGKPVELSKVRTSAEKIEDCETRKIDEWFKLEYPCDNKHLGS